MFTESVEAIIQGAVRKKEMLDRSRLRYLLSAGLAGAYVGLGIVLIFSVGAPLFAIKSPVASMAMGVSFGVALTLVIFAGSELFTGNNMYYTVSTLSGATTWKDTLRNWLWCYGGNLLGAMVLVGLVAGSGVFAGIAPEHLLFASAAKKMSLPFSQLFFRGILCNWFVCLAIWTSMRAKSDTAKLILIWWMLYGFIASGYEHSIANMTVLGLALVLPHPDTITLAGWLHNMIPVTLGNIVGGAFFVGVIYWLISPIKRKQADAGVKQAPPAGISGQAAVSKLEAAPPRTTRAH
ncbi:nitrite transporter NirC [Paenibacillus sp. UNCCL117]|uniref:formate/nitrite transporter family protein n=1 Tax=unclassified Paenibacillus TaxID=185978 RepID=UPI00088494CE|nr:MULTISPECIES: formate/nitrite transporter family protein [unclassified Paenibacillus]SDD62098.1 nitrite transporter NirC [Paenibacillus sp. cl123]SFW67603.1 nitrite transporter NirC [Paenibacillus sp. UNCCL117]